jgi:mono/diheme cytochrome c family protein
MTRARVLLLVAVAVVALGVGLAAAGLVGRPATLIARPFWEDGVPTSARPEAMPAVLERGRILYASRCSTCHGTQGDAGSGAARLMSVRPRDLTSGVFRLRSTAANGLAAPQDVFRTLTVGIAPHGMPSVDYLSESDRWALVLYVWTRSPLLESGTQGEAIIVGEAPRRTPELVEQGRQLFTKWECTTCHGDRGRGDGPRARELKDLWGVPIVPRDFASFRFKAGGRTRDIVRVLATGLPGTPMPSVFEQLKDRSDLTPLWALAYYVESLREEGRR